MKLDNQKQADRICQFFGYKTVYEYRTTEIRCHISYAEGHRPENEPFVTVLKPWYED